MLICFLFRFGYEGEIYTEKKENVQEDTSWAKNEKKLNVKEIIFDFRLKKLKIEENEIEFPIYLLQVNTDTLQSYCDYVICLTYEIKKNLSRIYADLKNKSFHLKIHVEKENKRIKYLYSILKEKNMIEININEINFYVEEKECIFEETEKKSEGKIIFEYHCDFLKDPVVFEYKNESGTKKIESSPFSRFVYKKRDKPVYSDSLFEVFGCINTSKNFFSAKNNLKTFFQRYLENTLDFEDVFVYEENLQFYTLQYENKLKELNEYYYDEIKTNSYNKMFENNKINSWNEINQESDNQTKKRYLIFMSPCMKQLILEGNLENKFILNNILLGNRKTRLDYLFQFFKVLEFFEKYSKITKSKIKLKNSFLEISKFIYFIAIIFQSSHLIDSQTSCRYLMYFLTKENKNRSEKLDNFLEYFRKSKYPNSHVFYLQCINSKDWIQFHKVLAIKEAHRMKNEQKKSKNSEKKGIFSLFHI